jgi:CheY-like chemotaxis protein
MRFLSGDGAFHGNIIHSLDQDAVPFCKRTMNRAPHIVLCIGTPPGILSRPGVPAGNFSKPEMERRGHLILCVDDEVVGLRVRKILLERAGYNVLTAPDGSAGLELFASEPVSAVVLDYAMPGMHGGEVAKRMRDAKPDVPILLLSAYVGLPDEVTSLVDVYMTKGEGAPALLNKLGNLLSSNDTSHPRAGEAQP